MSGEITEIPETGGSAEVPECSPEALEKFDRLFETGDFFDDFDESEGDCGREYTANGSHYKTDGQGRIVSCEAVPVYTENGVRDAKEQQEAGGMQRQAHDDGGHIVARVLGGAEGKENLVAMRSTINRGDYKKMENELARALQEGKEVSLDVGLSYEGESERPSEFRVEYAIDERSAEVLFDNRENSTELLGTLDGKIDDRDYQSLCEEIVDMRADGIEVSVTSVKTAYDSAGLPEKITVGIFDESAGEKSYRVYEPQQEGIA